MEWKFRVKWKYSSTYNVLTLQLIKHLLGKCNRMKTSLACFLGLKLYGIRKQEKESTMFNNISFIESFIKKNKALRLWMFS